MKKKFITITASGLGAGFVPFMPGTAGTAVGIPLYLLISYLAWPFPLLLLLVLTVLVWYVSEEAEKIGDTKDPPWVVADEIIGFQWTMLYVTPSVVHITFGFLFFRFFDIVKPFPLRLLEEKLKGGYGIVADDLAAAIYARLALMAMVYLSG